jgi:hypothetical protein
VRNKNERSGKKKRREGRRESEECVRDENGRGGKQSHYRSENSQLGYMGEN